MASGIPKIALWSTRFLQLIFSIILMGVLSYIIGEFHEFSHNEKAPREVLTPEIFSILSVIFTTFGIIITFFFGYYTQLTSAFLDLCIWIGYLASAGLLRHNYQTGRNKNPLEKTLNAIRRSHGARGHQSLNRHIVGLVSALVVIQIILYFFTIILSVFVARGSRRSVWADRPVSEKHSRFSFSRGSRASSEKPAVPVSTV